MLSKAFFLTALLCPSLLAASHTTYAQGTVTYDNPPSASPSDNSSMSQDGSIYSNNGYVGSVSKDGSIYSNNGYVGSLNKDGSIYSNNGYVGSISQDGSVYSNNGYVGSISQDGSMYSNNGYVGHAPNRGLGALMLLNVVPLQ